MVKVPGLSFPNSQKRTQMVLEGAKPVIVSDGISPVPPSSSQNSCTKGPVQLGAVYTAMPPSVTPAGKVSRITDPLAGTVRRNHTSPPA